MKAEANGEGPTLADVGAVLVQVRQPDGSLSLLPLKSIQDSPATLNVLLRHITGFTTPGEVVDRLLKGDSVTEDKQSPSLSDQEIIADGIVELDRLSREDGAWLRAEQARRAAAEERTAAMGASKEEMKEFAASQWARFWSPKRRAAARQAMQDRAGLDAAIIGLNSDCLYEGREAGRRAEEAYREGVGRKIAALEKAYLEGRDWRKLL